MNVKVTLYTTYDSHNSHNRDPVMLEADGNVVMFSIGDRALTVDKAELISAVRIFEMSGGA